MFLYNSLIFRKSPFVLCIPVIVCIGPTTCLSWHQEDTGIYMCSIKMDQVLRVTANREKLPATIILAHVVPKHGLN